MTLQLPVWLQRLSALALLGLVLAAVYLFGVNPMIAAYREVDAGTRNTEALLVRFQNIAASREGLQAQLKELERRQASSGFYLTGATDTLAGAQMQEMVSALVEKNGAQLRSVQILPAQNDGGFPRVTVRVQFITTTASFAKILYNLEAGRTFLFVDNLDVRNQRRRRRKTDEPSEPQLQVRFDLSGYQRPGAG